MLNALLSPPPLALVSMRPKPGLAVAPLVGEGSLSLATGVRPLGVHASGSVGVEWLVSLEGVVDVVAIVLVGERFGVDCRKGDGECGDSGLRKGDARGEPYDRGDGLYEADIACGEGTSAEWFIVYGGTHDREEAVFIPTTYLQRNWTERYREILFREYKEGGNVMLYGRFDRCLTNI